MYLGALLLLACIEMSDRHRVSATNETHTPLNTAVVYPGKFLTRWTDVSLGGVGSNGGLDALLLESVVADIL